MYPISRIRNFPFCFRVIPSVNRNRGRFIQRSIIESKISIIGQGFAAIIALINFPLLRCFFQKFFVAVYAFHYSSFMKIPNLFNLFFNLRASIDSFLEIRIPDNAFCLIVQYLRYLFKISCPKFSRIFSIFVMGFLLYISYHITRILSMEMNVENNIKRVQNFRSLAVGSQNFRNHGL